MITNNTARIGNFTSSEIVKLTALPKTKADKEAGNFGQPALDYIQEKNWERNLGKAIKAESNARPLSWGKLCEKIAFNNLGLEYTLCSDITLQHPEIPYWAGSPDGHKDKWVTVNDLKCPMAMDSFCQLVDPLYKGFTGMEAINLIRENHKDGEKYYWQLMSNACITGAEYAELIIYMPYQSELAEIRRMADGNKNLYWVVFSEDEELPFIFDGGYYKNINIIRFEVPEADKQHLTELVIKAGKLLEERPVIYALD